jgi:hypothetical protein
MPVKRSYGDVTVNVSDGGRLMPDLPPSRIGAANYDEKVNFRREDGEEVKIEGWDFPAPTDDWEGDGLANFNDGHPAEAIREVRRANGDVAIVGAGAGLIKYFNYDTNAWVTIGSGYSTQADAGFRFWQIEDIANYAVFNNGRDLPCTWQIGDASVTPIYEFREAGYASCGDICEFNGILRCADILEINDDDMADVMSDPQPYKTIVDSPITTRINYRRIWSNIENPRDFAATVPGSISAGTNQLTLQWPNASLQIGDVIYVTAAGSAGGNLRTTINDISPDGLTITLADNASTLMSGRDVFKDSAFETIVGHDDLGDDGAAIIRQMVLKNRLISLKASGHIFEEYYDGDLDQPFIAERMTKTPRALRFPRAILNISDKYLLFPGDRHFYRYTLGSQQLEEDPTVFGAEKALFFSRIEGIGKYEVWAADNGCTGEAIFAYRWNAYQYSYYGSNRALAVNYNEGRESCAEIDDFNFTCGAVVQKPFAGFTVDEVEQWFLMGDADGKFTQFGRSNLGTLTLLRYGEPFFASMGGGLLAAGSDKKPKYLRRFTLLPADPESSASVELTIYGAKATNVTPVALITKTLTNPIFPGVANLHYRKPYFKYRLRSNADTPLRIAGHVWEVSLTETSDVDRLS